MRKGERLFQLLNILRSRRGVVTSQEIAEQLRVSQRTVYRDIQALSLSNNPIEAEAGVGYRLRLTQFQTTNTLSLEHYIALQDETRDRYECDNPH